MQSHTLNFTRWVDDYADYLYSYAYYKIGKKEEAEDLVQDTFLSAYKNRETYNGVASEKTWLMAILKNKIVDYYRKLKATNNFSFYLDQTQETFEDSFFQKDNYGRWVKKINENYFSNAADSYLLGKEFQSILGSCLEKMPPKLRSVFVSKFLDEKKSEDICKEHNITPSNYWITIFRSKTLLRNCLEKRGAIS
ncbi:MAG TPA: sigma-70 family RNA polymerase sigma factor [Chitinophagaceae bacterium]|nr:sigma-70 family RNA polymerase sigma factor [Chitinophagaceae bacterium]